MKKYLFLVFAMCMMLACERKGDTIVNGNSNFDTLKDPEGTLISTVSSSGNSGDYVTFTPEATTSIYCDDNNRMSCGSGEIAIVGRLAGLAEITSLPANINWQHSVSVIPGYGYIQRVKASEMYSNSYLEYVDSEGYLYCRLYCIYSVGGVGGHGGRIVNVFKHQSPFVPSNVKINNKQ